MTSTAKEAQAEHSAWMERARKILETATKLKASMKKRGLTRARAKCPHCEAGHLHGRISGSRGHLHMACDGCNAAMME